MYLMEYYALHASLSPGGTGGRVPLPAQQDVPEVLREAPAARQSAAHGAAPAAHLALRQGQVGLPRQWLRTIGLFSTKTKLTFVTYM